MRSLYNILNVCATEEAMEYCSEFDGIKSILEYCNEHVKPFNKLVFRSGNESIINELTRRLQEYLVDRQLIEPDSKSPLPKAHPKLRKILMFLLANTDVIFKYNLREDTKYVHVIGICPLLPKFLTVALIWDLQLDEFFFEALSLTPCWYSFQFFEAAIESLKYIDDAKKVLYVIEQLLRALLISIDLSTLIELDDVDQKIIFNKFYDQVAILLRRFNTPDANVIGKMKKSELNRYFGFGIKHLLDITLFAIDLLESKHATPIPNLVYCIGSSFHKKNPKKKGYKRAVQEEVLRIINAVLSTLENCVMGVTMDMFVEWVEVDVSIDSDETTLQQLIGEKVFCVRERIAANPCIDHSVSNVLKPIEIRPIPLSTTIAKSSIGQILRKLDDSTNLSWETKKLWLDELFNRCEITLGNEECLETIKANLLLVTEKNCEQILDFIKLQQSYTASLNNDNDNDNDENASANKELIALILSALNYFTDENIVSLLIYQQQVFGDLYDGLAMTDEESNEFAQRVTEFLNKCTIVFDIHEFLLLCFEHPFRVWSEFFNSAGLTVGHVRHFSETVRKTYPFSFTYVDKLLKEAVLSTTLPGIYFPELLCELYFVLYRNERKVDFLAKFINSHMISCLNAENYDSLLPIVNALYLITQRNDALSFDELTAPMLATVAIVADLARWDLTSICRVRVELVGFCINFIELTLSRFLPTASEKDRKWLPSKIKSTCSSFTQFYFQSVLNQTNNELLSFDRFLCSEEILDRPKAVKFLNKVLVRCTGLEFKVLASSERFRPYISEAIHHLTLSVSSNSNSNAILNLRHCLAEYMIIVNDILKPQCSNGKETYELLHSILKLIALLPTEIYEQFFMETESLLKDMLKSSSGQISQEELTNLLDFVNTMPECTAKNIFLQSLKDACPSK